MNGLGNHGNGGGMGVSARAWEGGRVVSDETVWKSLQLAEKHGYNEAWQSLMDGNVGARREWGEMTWRYGVVVIMCQGHG